MPECRLCPLYVRTLSLLAAIFPDGEPEDNESHQDKQGDDADTLAGITGYLCDDADQGGAHKGSSLAANIQDAEIFATLLGRDDFCKVGTGQCLDAPLEHAHTYCQKPEFPLTIQKDGKYCNKEVGNDTHGN